MQDVLAKRRESEKLKIKRKGNPVSPLNATEKAVEKFPRLRVKSVEVTRTSEEQLVREES